VRGRDREGEVRGRAWMASAGFARGVRESGSIQKREKRGR